MNATPMNTTPMNATRQDSAPLDHVTWARGLASWAPRDPAALAPLPTAWAWLRGRRLAEGDRPCRRVVELLEEFAGASGTHLLRLYPPKALRGVMGLMGLMGLLAGLAPRAGVVWKRLSHLMDRLVAPLAEEARARAEQRLLAPLPARRARPDPVAATEATEATEALLARMAAHEVSPPLRRLLSAGGEEGPLRGRAWAPRNRSRWRAQQPRQRADVQTTQGKRAIPLTPEGGSTLASSW